MHAMLVSEQQAAEVVESVFTAMLSLPTVFGRDHSAIHGSVRLAASVQIVGAWNGMVLFLCTEPLGRRVGSIMLGIDAGSVKLSDVHDAVAELANIIGGGIKSVLPGPSALSLPSVTYGSHYNVHMPRTVEVARVDFTCDGEPLELRVLQALPGA